eukprot:5059484-Pleurochrysis_carterae.AAC.1
MRFRWLYDHMITLELRSEFYSILIDPTPSRLDSSMSAKRQQQTNEGTDTVYFRTQIDVSISKLLLT